MVDKAVPARGNFLEKILPARYVLCVLGCVAMMIIYGLKVNLSVAMVAMVKPSQKAITKQILHNVTDTLSRYTANIATYNITDHAGTILKMDGMNDLNKTLGDLAHNVSKMATAAFNEEEGCPGGVDQSVGQGTFEWSEPLQGTILSCYFWGYFISQLPGAFIAERVSAKYVMLFSVAINVVCVLLTPLAANFHWGAMIAIRIGQGIGGGVTFPSMHIMLASWAPPEERSVMSAIVYAGTALGTVISMFMAGQLAGSFGWESVFYVMGGLSCIWLVLWFIMIQDTPSQQPMISQEERDMIVNSLKQDDGHGNAAVKPKLPLKDIAKSLPFWAILVAHTCSNWGWYMLLIELPFYMKQVMKLGIKENAIATSVPFLTMWFFSMIISKVLDSLRARGKITTTIARKIATLFASVIPMCCLFAICFIGCNVALAIALMGIGVTSIGGMFCGFLSNHIDLSPNFAGTLMAITNTVATLPGIIVPIFVGQITHGNQTISAWQVIFFVTVGLYIVEILFYTTFGSGEEQPWNKGAVGARKNFENGDGAEATPLNVRDGKNLYTKTSNE